MAVQLQFTDHASQRCYDRGLDKSLVQDLWTTGKFVPYRNENGVVHAVAFVSDKHEYYELVLRGSTIITIMPLIWREAAVPDCIKLQAYAAANAVVTAEAKPVKVKAPKVRVEFKAEAQRLRLSYWPRGTEVAAVLEDLRRVPQYRGKTIEVRVGDSAPQQYRL